MYEKFEHLIILFCFVKNHTKGCFFQRLFVAIRTLRDKIGSVTLTDGAKGGLPLGKLAWFALLQLRNLSQGV